MLSFRVFPVLVAGAVVALGSPIIIRPALAQQTTPPVIDAVPVQPAEVLTEQRAVPADPTLPPQAAQQAPKAFPEAPLNPGARLAQVAVEEWMRDPRDILRPERESGLDNFVRVLVSSDAHTLPLLIGVAAEPAITEAQRIAIASGLASAAKNAEASSPAFSSFVLVQVAESNNPRFIADFNRALLRLNDPAEVETSEIGTSPGAPTGGAPGGSLTGTGNIGGTGNSDGSSTVATSGGSLTVGRGNAVRYDDSFDGNLTEPDTDPSRVSG